MPQIIGYCRVSTDGQTLDSQIAELKAAGATRLFAEKQSGARTDRPQLRKAIAALGAGDTLIVTRLDRLARSTRDLLNILHDVGECGAAFKSLADAWADTTTPHGRLMVTVLGGLAEFERSLIKARTDVGIKRAREAGIRFGRPPKLTRHQQDHAIKLLDAGEPQSAVARALNVDQSTISRLAAARADAPLAS
jgi:DNA invertase Pin-like site-specific DNA recombinase